MPIPESQLETWSHQGAVATSKSTYASIKGTVEAPEASYADKSFEVFLQGSYGNDTNIRGDSDVDVVVMLTSILRAYIADLHPDQQNAYHQVFPPSTCRFIDFKVGVISQLESTYGKSNIRVGNKSVKVTGSSGRLGADVIVCYEYRYYHRFVSLYDQRYDEGIIFPTSTGDIINYPKLHLQNCTAKHQQTGRYFKPVVRMFKNMRSRLIADGVIEENLAPSYFVEGLLFNVPDTQFKGDYQVTFCNCLNWLRGTDRAKFVCPSWMHYLFGPLSVQWNDPNCTRFLNALVDMWNGW